MITSAYYIGTTQNVPKAEVYAVDFSPEKKFPVNVIELKIAVDR